MDLFEESRERLRDQRVDFNAFRKIVADKARSLAEANALFEDLERHFSFYVDENISADTIQVWFGRRHTGRNDLAGAIVVESGASLVYSYGPTGDVLTILTPCSSSVAKTAEDNIYLHRGAYGIVALEALLPSDIRDLLAYGAVSSLDARAPLLAVLRIWWMRLTKPTQRNGEYTPPKWQFWLVSSAGAVAKGGITATGKILGPLIILAALAFLGLKGCSLYDAINSKVHPDTITAQSQQSSLSSGAASN